jgi:Gas vesicle synthesis protein GvpL/GvpF
MADELARWAAERAPGLLARAEAEALGVLRDALVAAALDRPQEGRPPDIAARSPEPRRSPAAKGEALWAYCVSRADAPRPEGLNGVVASAPVRRVEAGDLAALVSSVPLAEFGEEPLRRNLNDLTWLARIARAHEAVLERALSSSAIVPLRLCTIYATEGSVRDMLEREGDAFVEALELLDGRQEWGVKLLVDPERLAEEARSRSREAAALEDELEGRSGGSAYLVRRRLERHVREAASSVAGEIAEQVHARLQDWAIDAVSLRPQNRDLSGHEGEMLLNGAYLVEAERVDGFRELVTGLEERYRSLGARLELTGPWPPYNFVPHSGGAAIA